MDHLDTPVAAPKKLPKVAICLPTFDHVHTGFMLDFSQLMSISWRYADITVINHRSSLIHKARDLLVTEALKGDVDYVMFFDSDLRFPAFTLGRLLSLDKDIVGAGYVNRTPPHHLMVKLPAGSEAQVINGGVHEVALVPTGCLLVKADVFRKLGRPYFRSPSFEVNQLTPRYLEEYLPEDMRPITIGEDVNFCAQARSRGYRIWWDADLTTDIGHIGEHVYRVETHTTEEAAHKAPANLGNGNGEVVCER